jgi:hypothetical protein
VVVAYFKLPFMWHLFDPRVKIRITNIGNRNPYLEHATDNRLTTLQLLAEALLFQLTQTHWETSRIEKFEIEIYI